MGGFQESLMYKQCFSTKKWNSKKKLFDEECHKAQKYLIILVVVKDKENYQKHLHKNIRLIQKKRRIWEVTEQFHKTQETTCMCKNFGECPHITIKH